MRASLLCRQKPLGKRSALLSVRRKSLCQLRRQCSILDLTLNVSCSISPLSAGLLMKSSLHWLSNILFQNIMAFSKLPFPMRPAQLSAVLGWRYSLYFWTGAEVHLFCLSRLEPLATRSSARVIKAPHALGGIFVAHSHTQKLYNI